MNGFAPIWEDPYGLAVCKPPGLLTQPRGPHDAGPNLDAMVRAYLCPDAPARVYLGTVHRLDRPVSGVILWAKTPKAAHRWAEEFAQRRARKEYWALVSPAATGKPASLVAGSWDDWIYPPDQAGRARVVDQPATGAQSASTVVELGPPLEDRGVANGWVWLRLFPKTGRTHQLRAQAAARGWPIVGDSTYGSEAALGSTPGSGIALHARSLAIRHPVQRTTLLLEAPTPPAWGGLVPTEDPAVNRRS